MLGSIQSLGLATGLDTAGLIDRLGAIERRPAEVFKQQKSFYSARLSAFGVLRSRLAAVQDAAAEIDGLETGFQRAASEEEFLAYKVTSTDTDKVSVSGTSSELGSHTVEVTALASTNKLRHAGTADPSAALDTTDSLFVLDVGGKRVEFGITAGVTTLEDLRDAINNSGEAVRATIYDDPSAPANERYKLQVESTSPGLGNKVAIHSDTTLTAMAAANFTETRAAADASILFDDDLYTSSDGSFTQLIDGVTIEAKDLTAGTKVTIDVERDDAKTIGRVRKLVDALNDFLGFVRSQVAFDEDAGTAGVLSGESLVRSVNMRVRDALTRPVAGTTGPYRSLSAIGVTTEKDGTITLDEDKLRSALEADPEAVRKLFVSDGEIEGAAARLSRSLETTLDPIDGALKSRETATQARIDRYDERIEEVNAQADRYQERLFKQFQALETTIAQLQQTQAFLAAQLNTLV